MDKNVKTALYLLVLVLFIVSGFVWNVVSQSHQFKFNEITVFPKIKVISKFKLMDEKNQVFTNSNLQGKWSLVFFGYTHCPDVCPTTLANLNKIYRKLSSKDQQKLQIIFVSVDPERDNAAQLKNYLGFFNKNFIGVTGSLTQLTDFSREMGAVFFKGEVDKNGNYAVDHTSKVFVLNRQGERVGLFSGQATLPEKIYPIDKFVKELNFLVKH